MPRIDAAVATQIADVVRPAQSFRDAQVQAGDARARALAGRQDPGPAAPLPADDIRAISEQLKAVVEIASGRRLQFQAGQPAGRRGEADGLPGAGSAGDLSSIGFAVDPDHGNQTYVTIRDMDSGEVIKQIPTPEMRELRARLDKIVGLLLDQEA